jgi:hypothetical protein
VTALAARFWLSMKPLQFGLPTLPAKRHRCAGSGGADLHKRLSGSGRFSTATPRSSTDASDKYEQGVRPLGRQEGRLAKFTQAFDNFCPRHRRRRRPQGAGAAHFAAVGRSARCNRRPQAKVVRTSFLCIKEGSRGAGQEGHKVATMQRVTPSPRPSGLVSGSQHFARIRPNGHFSAHGMPTASASYVAACGPMGATARTRTQVPPSDALGGTGSRLSPASLPKSLSTGPGTAVQSTAGITVCQLPDAFKKEIARQSGSPQVNDGDASCRREQRRGSSTAGPAFLSVPPRQSCSPTTASNSGRWVTSCTPDARPVRPIQGAIGTGRIGITGAGGSALEG